jgi:hypothetical protein
MYKYPAKGNPDAFKKAYWIRDLLPLSSISKNSAIPQHAMTSGRMLTGTYLLI